MKLPDGHVVNSNTADRIFDARCIAQLYNGFNEFANAPAVRRDFKLFINGTAWWFCRYYFNDESRYQRLLLMNEAADYIDYSLRNYGIRELIAK